MDYGSLGRWANDWDPATRVAAVHCGHPFWWSGFVLFIYVNSVFVSQSVSQSAAKWTDILTAPWLQNLH